MRFPIFTPIAVIIILLLILFNTFVDAAEWIDIEYKTARITLGNTTLEVPVPEYYSERDIIEKVKIPIITKTILKPKDSLYTYKEINDALEWKVPKDWDFHQRTNQAMAPPINCDTDAHCIDAAAYSSRGITGITFVNPGSPFYAQGQEDMVKVECSDVRVKYIVDKMDLYNACMTTDDLISSLKEEMYHKGPGYSGIPIDVTTLQGLIKEGLVDPNKRISSTTPTAYAFLLLMEQHRDYPVEVLCKTNFDLYTDPQTGETHGLEHIDNLDFDVTINRLQLTNVNHTPKWFSDFCEYAAIKFKHKGKVEYPVCIWK